MARAKRPVPEGKVREPGDGRVVMSYRDDEGVEYSERVYPCEANAWQVAHRQQPHYGMFGHGGSAHDERPGEVTEHYHSVDAG